MMSGKAFSRALRGHFLVECALTAKLIKLIVADSDLFSDNDMLSLKSLLTDILSTNIDGEDCDIYSHDAYNKMVTAIEMVKSTLSDKSRMLVCSYWCCYVVAKKVTILMVYDIQHIVEWLLFPF